MFNLQIPGKVRELRAVYLYKLWIDNNLNHVAS